ncbi:hypothetical protein MSG28_011192 [Choristoneura fumiferana]|uniref:Uncharacterized protein n=1 Tax=Choristoneura fumiferana TaxID=7141 RepID=A0ACC0KRN1_CHOFU|nr:hypothetical protein MSG28_011192 [Choristoneura fumiferana]
MSVKESLPVKNKYELVPPDGGYGYVILLAVSVNYNFGMGLLFNLSCTAINDYFKEKRLISLSVVNTVTAAAAIIAPTLVDWTTTKFELRGTLIMILAVGSMTFVGSSLFQPVAWHMKKIEIEEETPEIKLLLESFNNEKETEALATPVIKMTDPEKDSVAWAFSLQAIGDIVTRVVFIFSSTVFKILGSHLLYVIGLLVAISTKLALLWVTDHTALLCIITIMGISRCSIIVLFPLVVSDSVRPQVFPSAMGVSMLIFGLSSIIMGPVTGFFTGPLLKMMSMRKLAFSASFFFNAAAATMVAPMIVGWCSTHYGFRGTLILISAVALQTFVASGLLQPVAWHMKKVAIKETAPGIAITSIKNFLDWPLFKKFVLTCGCLGAPISIFADVTYVFFLAQALYDLKWTEDGVAWAFALIGFGDIATRIVFIFSSVWLNKLGSHLIYVIGLLIAIVTKLDSVKSEEFPSAMGISMMIYGLVSIIMGPIIGAVRDATGNYTTMFVILIGFMVAVTIAWSFELVINKRKRRTILLDDVPQTIKNEIN